MIVTIFIFDFDFRWSEKLTLTAKSLIRDSCKYDIDSLSLYL